MENVAELRALAKDIEARRVVLDLSKNMLCQKFGQLGSTKTFGRILDDADSLEGMDTAKQLANYRAALELLNSYSEDPEENKIYADFEFMREALATVTECLQVSDNTRLILVTSASGGGKTTFVDCLREDKRFAPILSAVEATEAWRSKPGALLGALLTEIGVFERADRDDKDKKRSAESIPFTMGTDQRLTKLIERMDGRRMIIAVDEAHHLGPEGFNVIKTIINMTRAVVITLAHPQLIARINKNAYAETSQLWQNRMFEHVKLPPPSAGDVIEFLCRRGVKFASPKQANQIGDKVADDAMTFGLWKYVKRCAREARKTGKSSFDVADFAAVITRVKSKISLGG